MVQISCARGKNNAVIYYADGKRISKRRASMLEDENEREIIRTAFEAYEKAQGIIPVPVKPDDEAADGSDYYANEDIYVCEISFRFYTRLTPRCSGKLGTRAELFARHDCNYVMRGYKQLEDAQNAAKYFVAAYPQMNTTDTPINGSEYVLCTNLVSNRRKLIHWSAHKPAN